MTRRQHESLLVCSAARQCEIVYRQTFIFPYVFERKGEARVLALDDAYLAECTFADDSQQAEVVEVYCLGC